MLKSFSVALFGGGKQLFLVRPFSSGQFNAHDFFKTPEMKAGEALKQFGTDLTDLAQSVSLIRLLEGRKKFVELSRFFLVDRKIIPFLSVLQE